MSTIILESDVVAEIYGALQASADHYEKHDLPHAAIHARSLAFSLLDAEWL